MRLRKLKNEKDILDNSKYIISNPKDYKGNWKKLFNNTNPIHIEIGSGKGNFILNNAINNPNINYIGIERYDSPLSRAIKKIEKTNLSNLKMVRIDAEELNDVFDKEIDIIYLNFSDPWPKDRHEKRRLTHEHFLKIYDNIFINDKIIIQKTDNIKLFEYSVCSLVNYGYKLEELNLDLHKEKEEIITTEYEEKFMKLGPIYRAVYKKQ